MNTLLRNFSHTFRRFFTASVLNLLGLSIAFFRLLRHPDTGGLRL